MPINVPSLDDRDYANILQDALDRIPVHNPEWTNFNDSDPGVTLIQLFAFMTESILYRANQIPERNRLKFLQLLGIRLVPAAAAKGFITITNDRGPLLTQTLPKNLDVRAGQIRFRTTKGLDVLPITSQIFYKRPIENTEEQKILYRQLYADLLGEQQEPAFYETAVMAPPYPDGTLPTLDLAETVDGCLWIALLARSREDLSETRLQLMGKTLTLGVMPRLDETGLSVMAGQTQRTDASNPLCWEIADATTTAANYLPLASPSTESILTVPSLVELKLPETVKQLTSWNFADLEPGLEGTGDYPPSLIDSDLGERLVTWIRLRLDKTVRTDENNSAIDSLKVRLSWVGSNATQVQQRVQVNGEVVGTGTGEPDQVFRLANFPVIPDSVELIVEDNSLLEKERFEPWQQINDLLAADPEVSLRDPRLPVYRPEISASRSEVRPRVFLLDPESGLITFGDGAHGTRPRGRIVVNYAFGGGRQGNVGIGSINRSPQLPAGYTVTNPLRTWGGDNAQDINNAEKGISRYVQHRDRLVAVQDFEDITRQTPGIDLGRVAVLPLYIPTAPTGADIPGAVTVMVIPASPNNNNPLPDQFFLEAVCNHLQPRRLITTELHVYGPQYVDVWISVGIELLGGYGAGPVREAVKQELYRFLSPLYGGQQGTGWPLNVSVLQAELEAVVARVEGVRLVNDPLRLGTATANDVTTIALTGLMLPRLVGVSVVSGSAIALDQLRNAPSVATAKSTPIPVLPERC